MQRKKGWGGDTIEPGTKEIAREEGRKPFNERPNGRKRLGDREN